MATAGLPAAAAGATLQLTCPPTVASGADVVCSLQAVSAGGVALTFDKVAPLVPAAPQIAVRVRSTGEVVAVQMTYTLTAASASFRAPPRRPATRPAS